MTTLLFCAMTMLAVSVYALDADDAVQPLSASSSARRPILDGERRKFEDGAIAQRDEVLIPKVVHHVWYSVPPSQPHSKYNFDSRWLELGASGVMVHHSIDALLGDSLTVNQTAWQQAVRHFAAYPQPPQNRLCQSVVFVDFMKLLVLYVHGGIVADYDVEPRTPLSQWKLLGRRFNGNDAARHGNGWLVGWLVGRLYRKLHDSAAASPWLIRMRQ